MCDQKLTGIQFSLPHDIETKRKLKTEKPSRSAESMKAVRWVGYGYLWWEGFVEKVGFESDTVEWKRVDDEWWVMTVVMMEKVNRRGWDEKHESDREIRMRLAEWSRKFIPRDHIEMRTLRNAR